MPKTIPSFLSKASEEKVSLQFEEIEGGNSEWEAFVKNQTDCLFFYPHWGRIIERAYKSQHKVYVLKQNGEIKLGLPAALFDFKWFRLIHAHAPYGGFVGNLDLIPSFLQPLEAHVSQKGIHLIRITEIWNKNYPLPEYRFYRSCQHLLNLQGMDEKKLKEQYKESASRAIRKAMKAGIHIRPMTDLKEIDRYYSIYRETMRRKKVFGQYPRALYHEIWQELVPTGEATFLAAELNHQLIAGLILIFSGRTAYFFGNASDAKFLGLRPNDLLIHEGILLSLRRGLDFFDFMTTGEAFEAPGELSRFKEKWGARRYPFTIYEKELSPLRARLWKKAWRWANSPLGSVFVRLMINR